MLVMKNECHYLIREGVLDIQRLLFLCRLIGARIGSESKKGDLGEGFGLLHAHIGSNMLQNINYGRTVVLCLDDARTIQFTGFNIPSHIVKHTAP